MTDHVQGMTAKEVLGAVGYMCDVLKALLIDTADLEVAGPLNLRPRTELDCVRR